MTAKRINWLTSTLLALVIHSIALLLLLSARSSETAAGSSGGGGGGGSLRVAFASAEIMGPAEDKTAANTMVTEQPEPLAVEAEEPAVPVESEPTVETPEPVVEELVAQTATPVTVKPEPEPKARPKPKPKPQKAAKVEARPTTPAPQANNKATANTSVTATSQPATEATTLTNAAPGLPGPGNGGTSRPGSGTGTADPSVQQSYHATLRAWLEQHKRYPERAIRRRMQGEALLYIKLDSNGQVIAHELRQGTGHAMLDREVQAMLRRASPLPAIPDSLSMQTMEFTVPVAFNIYTN